MQAIVTHFGLLLIRDSEPTPQSLAGALCSWRRRPLSQWTPARRVSLVVGISAAVRRACNHKSVEGQVVPNPRSGLRKKEIRRKTPADLIETQDVESVSVF